MTNGRTINNKIEPTVRMDEQLDWIEHVAESEHQLSPHVVREHGRVVRHSAVHHVHAAVGT